MGGGPHRKWDTWESDGVPRVGFIFDGTDSLLALLRESYDYVVVIVFGKKCLSLLCPSLLFLSGLCLVSTTVCLKLCATHTFLLFHLFFFHNLPSYVVID